MRVRPLAAGDIRPVMRLLDAALPPPWPDPHRRARSVARMELALEHDPGGAWVGEDDDGLAGIALAVRREGIWVLAWLGVHPGVRSAGLGSELLAAGLSHGEGCRGFLIASSDDARAMRLYARAGFDLHPSVLARGRPAGLAPTPGVRVGRGDADLEHCLAVDRAVRGGARRIDVESWVAQDGRLYVTGNGYAVGREGWPLTVAARSDDEAAALLRRVLADAEDREVEVNWITAEQGWALRTVLDAGLRLDRGYAYFTRGELGPLTPWLPNNSLL